jgi:enoyl-CoA hydratase
LQSTETSPVIARRQGRIGRITLNRPRALNALDLDMLHALAATLDAWRDEPDIHAVVIEGAGGRAFCAGGDIRAIRDAAIQGDHEGVERFFAAEYALNLTIATYPKPYVALVDGICMGGGVGVSVHGASRAASEAALFAMPETAIGFFPDIGASYVLPRLRGAVGIWMGLTGARLGGADAAWAGLVTHFVPRARLATLADELAEHGVAALAPAAEPPPAALPRRIEAINRCFGAASVAEILRRLDAEDDDWAREQIAALRALSPSATLWAFELLRQGAGRSLLDCLAAELALSRHATRHPDFLEGVRAMVVDKDRSPRWSPARIEDVDPASIAALFT